MPAPQHNDDVPCGSRILGPKQMGAPTAESAGSGQGGLLEMESWRAAVAPF